MSTLKILSICGCGVEDLFGIDYVPHLKEFHAACNRLIFQLIFFCIGIDITRSIQLMRLVVKGYKCKWPN